MFLKFPTTEVTGVGIPIYMMNGSLYGEATSQFSFLPHFSVAVSYLLHSLASLHYEQFQFLNDLYFIEI